MRTALLAVLLLCAAPVAAQVVDLDQPKQEVKGKPDLWTKAAEADAKKAEEAARRDACVQLAEEAYRLPVAGNRDVLDMMIKNSQVNADVIKALADAKPIHAEYLEDGTVRIMVSTTPAEVMGILKKAYEKVDWDRAEEDSTLAAVAVLTKKDEVITAVGEGALAGSVGEKRLPVRRAALLKAEEEIAGKFLAMILRDDARAQDRVHDFCLGIPQAQKKTALGLTAARIYSEQWADDGSLELRAEVSAKVMTGLLHRAETLYDGRGKYADWGWWGLMKGSEEMILQGTGKAKPGDAAPENVPLGPESRAVDAAMKAAQKK